MSSIRIIAGGKSIEKKVFDVNIESKVRTIKKHILSRLTYKDKYINPDWNKSYIIRKGKRLDDKKTIRELINNHLLKEDDELDFNVILTLPNGNTISYNNEAKEILEWAYINPIKKIYFVLLLILFYFIGVLLKLIWEL